MLYKSQEASVSDSFNEAVILDVILSFKIIVLLLIPSLCSILSLTQLLSKKNSKIEENKDDNIHKLFCLL